MGFRHLPLTFREGGCRGLEWACAVGCGCRGLGGRVRVWMGQWWGEGVEKKMWQWRGNCVERNAWFDACACMHKQLRMHLLGWRT